MVLNVVLLYTRMEEECVTVNEEVCISGSSGSTGVPTCKTVYDQQCSTTMEAHMETIYKDECSTVPEQVGEK